MVSACWSMPWSGNSYSSILYGLRHTLAQWLGFRQFRHSHPYAGQLSLVLQECSRPELGHCIYLLLLLGLLLISRTSLFQSPANCSNCDRVASCVRAMWIGPSSNSISLFLKGFFELSFVLLHFAAWFRQHIIKSSIVCSLFCQIWWSWYLASLWFTWGVTWLSNRRQMSSGFMRS